MALLALPLPTAADPLAPVAPSAGVTIVAQSPEIQDEPRIVLARLDDPGPKANEPKSSPPEAKKEPKDPFAALKVVVAKDKLPPLRTVRVPNPKELQTAKEGNISVTIGSSPSGASVSYGGRSLGVTPLSVSAPRGSTPMEVVIRARGRMTLRTRIRRKVNRSYYFKLHPAKIR